MCEGQGCVQGVGVCKGGVCKGWGCTKEMEECEDVGVQGARRCVRGGGVQRRWSCVKDVGVQGM